MAYDPKTLEQRALKHFILGERLSVHTVHEPEGSSSRKKNIEQEGFINSRRRTGLLQDPTPSDVILA